MPGEEWGEASVERFNGMFAFALWDARRRRLFLARDRWGSPLYWTLAGDALVFGSEISGNPATPKRGRNVSFPRLGEYFSFQNIFSDPDAVRGIRLLPPGHTMTLDVGTGVPAVAETLLGLPVQQRSVLTKRGRPKRPIESTTWYPCPGVTRQFDE